MQRIIAYMAYLENTLRHLSSELDIDPDPSLLLLTSNVQDIEESGWSNCIFSNSLKPVCLSHEWTHDIIVLFLTHMIFYTASTLKVCLTLLIELYVFIYLFQTVFLL